MILRDRLAVHHAREQSGGLEAHSLPGIGHAGEGWGRDLAEHLVGVCSHHGDFLRHLDTDFIADANDVAGEHVVLGEDADRFG